MASLMRDSCRSPSRRSSARRACARALVEYVPVGLPPPSLLDQLVCDMQRHLEEMERVRAVLLDAYPCLATTAPASSGSSSAICPRSRRGSRRPSAEVSADDDANGQGYRFSVDVAGFSPEELSVKLEGRRLTVTCKRDRKTEAADGCVSREYREVRKELRLPADADLEGITCTLGPDADCLCVQAPRQQLLGGPERTIPISVPGADAAPAPALGQAPPVASLPPAKEAPVASPEAPAAPAA